MYVLDPKSGRRRRMLLRDKGVHVSRVIGHGFNVTGRDIGHRFQGAIAKGLSVFKGRDISDEVLIERVRAELGRAVTNSSGIKVNAKDGEVHLSGSILQHEYHPLLKRIRRIAGVRYLVDRLTPRWPMGEGSHQPGTIWRGGHWPPAKRAFAIAAGAGALFFAIKERNKTGAVVGAAGASLVARGIANRSPREFKNLWEGLRRHAS
jgi:hypothetical protein